MKVCKYCHGSSAASLAFFQKRRLYFSFAVAPVVVGLGVGFLSGDPVFFVLANGSGFVGLLVIELFRAKATRKDKQREKACVKNKKD